MSLSDWAFTWPTLPTGCEAKAEAEPKRNISRVGKDDFSSNIIQVGSPCNPSMGVTARSVPDETNS
jgi:hypothetical protein